MTNTLAICEDEIFLSMLSLHDLLRSSTSEIHERLHNHRGFAAVQAGTINRLAYTALLGRLYGFHKPFEIAAQIAPQRTQWLESDLAALDLDSEKRSSLPQCANFPKSASSEYILGARYVVEGSALGGRGLAKQLDALLGSGAVAGRRFFSGHAAETGAIWRNYLSTLSMVPTTLKTRVDVVAGANSTFAIFEQWLDGWDD